MTFAQKLKQSLVACFGESYSDLILVSPVTKQVSSSCKQETEQWTYIDSHVQNEA